MTKIEILNAIAAATNNEIYDPEWRGGQWMVEAVETHETIDDFIASSDEWNERSAKMNRGTIAGFPFVSWANVQARRGDQRRALSVIDIGNVRIAINTDLTDF